MTAEVVGVCVLTGSKMFYEVVSDNCSFVAEEGEYKARC